MSSKPLASVQQNGPPQGTQKNRTKPLRWSTISFWTMLLHTTYIVNHSNILFSLHNLQGTNKCNSCLVMTMLHRLLFRSEKSKTQKGLINLDDVIQQFPILGSNKLLPKVLVAVAIMLVTILIYGLDLLLTVLLLQLKDAFEEVWYWLSPAIQSWLAGTIPLGSYAPKLDRPKRWSNAHWLQILQLVEEHAQDEMLLDWCHEFRYIFPFIDSSTI